MVRRKNPRARGKLKFSRAFQNIKVGNYVSVVREEAMQPRFPKRIQGRTGIVEEKRGNSFMIKINDGNKPKRFIISPIHLKRINYGVKNDK